MSKTLALVTKCLADTSALVTKCLGFLQWCRGHFGTSAEMSRVQSVLGPKCPYTDTLTGRLPSLSC